MKIPPWVSSRFICQSFASRKPYKKTLKYIFLVYKKVKFFGSMIKWLQAEVLTRMLFDSKDMHNIFHVSSDERVVNLIRKIHEDRSRMEHVCVNYDTYRVELE